MKKVTWIIIIAIIILAGIICAVVYDQAKKAVPGSKILDPSNINEIQEDDGLMNKVNGNETENNIMQNELVENEIVQNTQSSGNQTSQEEPKNDKEKAIQIVKKDYGIAGNIEFSSEGTDANGNQIVVVRDGDTTAALAFYFVNTSNGTFTKKEMN